MCQIETKPYKVSIPKGDVSIVNAAKKRAKTITINREYDIPYLAGYNQAGDTIYIDRHLPEYFKYKGKKVMTDRLLCIHECVESALIHKAGYKYIPAHRIATDEECRGVLAAGVPWKEYDKFMQEYVKKADDEKLTSCPKDLDMTPYTDEQDKGKIRAIMAAE